MKLIQALKIPALVTACAVTLYALILATCWAMLRHPVAVEVFAVTATGACLAYGALKSTKDH